MTHATGLSDSWSRPSRGASLSASPPAPHDTDDARPPAPRLIRPLLGAMRPSAAVPRPRPVLGIRPSQVPPPPHGHRRTATRPVTNPSPSPSLYLGTESEFRHLVRQPPQPSPCRFSASGLSVLRAVSMADPLPRLLRRVGCGRRLSRPFAATAEGCSRATEGQVARASRERCCTPPSKGRPASKGSRGKPARLARGSRLPAQKGGHLAGAAVAPTRNKHRDSVAVFYWHGSEVAG